VLNLHKKITLIIGHRGTGKTEFLSRLKAIDPGNSYYDLDYEIEKSHNCTISDIFHSSGEKKFREMEEETLVSLIKKQQNGKGRTYISLGAGFQGSLKFGNVHVLFLRRSTDKDGRIFFDRPRLDCSKSALEEFRDRYLTREEFYYKNCHSVYHQLEGALGETLCLFEKKYLLGEMDPLGAVMTIPPHLSCSSLKSWINQRIPLGLDYFELRDDLLSEDQVNICFELVPNGQILFSFRDELLQKKSFKRIEKNKCMVDWPLEFGDLPQKWISPSRTIISCHDKKDDAERFEDILKRLDFFKDKCCLLKLAPKINNLKELEAGHDWLKLNPQQNCFLPRCSDNFNLNMSFYRLLTKKINKLNFIKEYDFFNFTEDQPFLIEWICENFSHLSFDKRRFAAIVGDPVKHSLTPTTHMDYFFKKSMPVVRINLTREQFSKQDLLFLLNLGLSAAAITSPLKVLAFEHCEKKSPRVKKFQSCNTFALSSKDKILMGENTDYVGLEVLFSSISKSDTIVVWGGGGTLPLIEDILPRAHCYSARTGKPRCESSAHIQKQDPVVLIWASGTFKDLQLPPSTWNISHVIDLSYMKSSYGAEIALKRQISYRSGIDMFMAQARAQQEFWDQHL
jgi:shikimate kinase